MTFAIVRGLDIDANGKLNEAVLLANDTKSRTVNTYHLAYVLLEDTRIADQFNHMTELDTDDFVNDQLEAKIQHDNMNIFINNSEIDLNSASDNLRMFIATAVKYSHEHHSLVDPRMMFNLLMCTPFTEFYNLLIEAGVSKEKLEISNNDTLSIPTILQFGVDLTKLAKENKLDPMALRDDVIGNTIEVLGRRQKGNPCLIGDAGVGKTSIIEGLAQRIESGDVPFYLKGKHIVQVDISAIVAGAKYRGEFEERFNAVLEEAAANPNVILFFDEFHLLADAGSSGDNPMNASNMLKPALSRGDIRIIGATTTAEYKKYIEKNPAFERRLQSIMVEEPSIDDSIKMLSHVAGVYEKYHNATIDSAVIESAVKLSDRYVTSKKLPDKAITLIDETAARLKAASNGEHITVTVPEIRKTISNITGIEVSDLGKSDIEKLKGLDSKLKQQVIGQEEAIDVVSKAIKRGKAGINNPNKPIATFLFVGPTGVGKTELCKAIARTIYGGEKNIIRLDMSEYMEKHSVSRLIGSPPGYVGYEEGGVLTDTVKHNPYSIILVDEIEKAHADVFNIFLQIMDDGRLTDSHGVTVDFNNTLIVMTSNAGYGATSSTNSIGFNSDKVKQTISEKDTMKALECTFRPEFLNRIDSVVVFNNLTEPDIKEIAKLMLTEISNRASFNGISLHFSENVVDYLCKEGFSEKFGARNMRRHIQNTLENYLADLIISGDIAGGNDIFIDMNGNNFAYAKHVTIEAHHKRERKRKTPVEESMTA